METVGLAGETLPTPNCDNDNDPRSWLQKTRKDKRQMIKTCTPRNVAVRQLAGSTCLKGKIYTKPMATRLAAIMRLLHALLVIASLLITEYDG